MDQNPNFFSYPSDPAEKIGFAIGDLISFAILFLIVYATFQGIFR